MKNIRLIPVLLCSIVLIFNCIHSVSSNENKSDSSFPQSHTVTMGEICDDGMDVNGEKYLLVNIGDISKWDVYYEYEDDETNNPLFKQKVTHKLHKNERYTAGFGFLFTCSTTSSRESRYIIYY